MDYLPSWPLHVTPLTAFGLMLIIGVIGGYTAHRFRWLPSITGFMLAGFVCGPNGLGWLNHEIIAESRVFIDIALALILYRLGLSLDLKSIWHSPRLLLTSLIESFATLGLVTYLLYLCGIPIVIAVLVAAITVSSSPAVLLHVAHEVGARGIVTESSKTLVALNNLISFVAFSAVLPVLHYANGADWATTLLQPLYQLFGSLLVGLVLAYVLHVIAVKTHDATQYKLALVIGMTIAAVGLVYELKLSLLFTPLVMGVVVKSLERKSIVSDLDFGAAFELFFIVLFVFAGAGLHIEELATYAPIIGVLVLARSAAKIFGVAATSAALREPLRTGISRGLLLIPMAGLAVGLVLNANQLFPKLGPTIAAFVLGAVAVFETIGPPIAAFAFRFAGESTNGNGVAKAAETDAEHTAAYTPPEDLSPKA